MKPVIIATSFMLLTKTFGLVYARSKELLEQPIRFQSFESKTLNDGPVFNKIKLFQYADKDVWMMNQSHFGLNTSLEKQDRLAIVIEKNKIQKTAYFMQIEPGPLEWSESLYQKKINFKVSCFICHANGPRAIRADLTGEINLSYFNQIKIKYLNSKIVEYGLVKENQLHQIEDLDLKTPFRYRGVIENEELNLKKCTKCQDGVWRSKLTRQNFLPIQFLIKNHQMPPNKNLNSVEIQKIKKFIDGF